MKAVKIMYMQQELAPGEIVINPTQPDWGLGQVQSVVGTRVTVNFEHMGKMTINTTVVTLEPVAEDPRPFGVEDSRS